MIQFNKCSAPLPGDLRYLIDAAGILGLDRTDDVEVLLRQVKRRTREERTQLERFIAKARHERSRIERAVSLTNEEDLYIFIDTLFHVFNLYFPEKLGWHESAISVILRYLKLLQLDVVRSEAVRQIAGSGAVFCNDDISGWETARSPSCVQLRWRAELGAIRDVELCCYIGDHSRQADNEQIKASNRLCRHLLVSTGWNPADGGTLGLEQYEVASRAVNSGYVTFSIEEDDAQISAYLIAQRK